MTTTREERKLCREFVGLSNRDYPPVVVVRGNLKPRLVGESYHWTNRSGQRVRHPSAYARKGWSSLVYNPSTRTVEVGEHWLAHAVERDPGRFVTEVRRALRRVEVEP